MNAPLRVSGYGKLPIHDEYLEYQCADGAAKSFRVWLLNAFMAGMPALGVPLRMLYFDSGYRYPVVARIADSTDSAGSGTRRFPFCCFATVDQPLALSPREQVLSLMPAWAGLDQHAATLAESRSVADFKTRIKVMEVPGPLDMVMSPGDGTFVARLLGDEPQARFADVLWEIRAAVDKLRSQTIPGDRIPPLRLPLVPQLDAAVQVAAWLGMLETSGFLPRPVSVTLAFPLEVTANSSNLWVLIRPPLKRDLTTFASTVTGYLGDATIKVQKQPALYGGFARRVAAGIVPGRGDLGQLSRFNLFS
jgi:hypothetical protein